MEHVIDTFMAVAADSRDWQLMLRYKWVLTEEKDQFSQVEDMMKEKAKGA